MSLRVKYRNDANHADVVTGLLATGRYAVQTLNQGGGVPDLLTCDKQTGELALVEVKGEDGKLTPAQVKWQSKWPGRVIVAHTAAEALSDLERTT